MRSFTSLFLVVCMFACSLLADYPQLPYYTDIFSLTSDGALKRFSLPDTTTVKSSVKITGLQKNEVALDIDIRPATGALYAITFNRNTTKARLITVNTTTGRAHVVGPLAGCTLYSYPDPNTPRYGIDFDPTTDTLYIVGQDTQQFSVNPATGACTKGTNLFFNGRGRGSTPTRAVAFTNNILPSSSTNEYILTGVHLTIVNTADHAGNYIIRESVATEGPFDIGTAQTGSAQLNLPLLITPVYNISMGGFDFSDIELRSISLETGVQETIGTFRRPAAGVYFYGLAILPVGWTDPTTTTTTTTTN